MRSNKQNNSRTSLMKIKGLISHPVLSGLVTIISLIAFARSNDPWVQVPSALVAIGVGIFFFYIIRIWVQNVITWLTWKFFVGVVFGIIVGSIATPFIFQPFLLRASAIIAPKIEIVDPPDRSIATLSSPLSGVVIRFSEPIPSPYFYMMNVVIEPDYPINIEWMDSSHQWLAITPKKIYPARENGGLLNPRFSYGETYYLTITAPVLESPYNIEIHSPSQ